MRACLNSLGGKLRHPFVAFRFYFDTVDHDPGFIEFTRIREVLPTLLSTVSRL